MMKGLIIKDLMCLKKQLTVFVYVLVGVLIVSVMYVLSARYGNIARAGAEMLVENDMSEIDVKNLSSMALVFFMLLPIAVIGDMANVFEADGKAGFNKVAGAFPVPLRTRLLSRYITICALFSLGVLIDILIALVLSTLTDLISLSDFLGIIVSAASVMSIYSALVIFFCLVFGYGKEQYAQICSLGTMVLSLILLQWKSVKRILTVITESNPVAAESIDSSFIWGALDFIKEKAWILFLIAATVSILSYGASLLVAERKRGVI
ncbi:MAG: ABC-2 transporter permease [Lachnospiraceae bacterium]|nr:ABC-2 transporter permease [Lachnospiraceae bacterium]